jgi:hypothetical protein
MKNKIISVTDTELNTHAVLEKDSVMSITINPYVNAVGSETRKYLPRRINFINKSGVDVKVNIMDKDDYTEYHAGITTNYPLFTIANGTMTTLGTMEQLAPAYKILVQAPTGDATSTFEIECLNYHPAELF